MKGKAGFMVLLSFTFLFVLFFVLPVYAGDMDEYAKLETLYNEYIIMPESLVYKIQSNDRDYVLFDLRESSMYKRFHVVGAVNFPWEKWQGLNFDNGLSEIPKGKLVILISSDGFYSLKALEFLLRHGYKNVYSIEGGMDNWPYKKLLVSGK